MGNCIKRDSTLWCLLMTASLLVVIMITTQTHFASTPCCSALSPTPAHSQNHHALNCSHRACNCDAFCA